jgi:hypothetical protein
MNIDPNTIDVSKLTSQQLRELQGTIAQDRCSQTGSDFVTSWNQCKLLFPKLWAATPTVSAIPENAQRLPLPANTPGYTPVTRPMPAGALQRLRNPFPVNPRLDPAIANDMDQKAVRATYADAFKKHLSDNPDDGPIVAHRKVMAAHPALAAAMRKKKPAAQNDPGTDAADDDDDDAATATANSRSALANSVALGNCIDTDKPFLMLSNGDGWALA